VGKRERVLFECNKDRDYLFASVQRLIKVAYGEVEKLTLFNPGYKDSIKITLPSGLVLISSSTNKELLR